MNTYINLSKTQPYGKAFFYNVSPYDTRLYLLDDEENMVIIKPYSSGYII